MSKVQSPGARAVPGSQRQCNRKNDWVRSRMGCTFERAAGRVLPGRGKVSRSVLFAAAHDQQGRSSQTGERQHAWLRHELNLITNLARIGASVNVVEVRQNRRGSEKDGVWAGARGRVGHQSHTVANAGAR